LVLARIYVMGALTVASSQKDADELQKYYRYIDRSEKQSRKGGGA